jgi:hypothetical protein
MDMGSTVMITTPNQVPLSTVGSWCCRESLLAAVRFHMDMDLDWQGKVHHPQQTENYFFSRCPPVPPSVLGDRSINLIPSVGVTLKRRKENMRGRRQSLWGCIEAGVSPTRAAINEDMKGSISFNLLVMGLVLWPTVHSHTHIHAHASSYRWAEDAVKWIVT